MAKGSTVMGGFSDEAKQEIANVTSALCDAITNSVNQASILMSTMDGKAKNNITTNGTNNLSNIADVLQHIMIEYKESVIEAMNAVISFGDRNGDDGMVQNGNAVKKLLDSYVVPACQEPGIVPGGAEVMAVELEQFSNDLKTLLYNACNELQNVKPKLVVLKDRETIYKPSFIAVWKTYNPILDQLDNVSKALASGTEDALNNTVTFQKATKEKTAAVAGMHTNRIVDMAEQSRKDTKNAVDNML